MLYRKILKTRAGKNTGFIKKTQPTWGFLGFMGFFGFYWTFWVLSNFLI